MPDALDRRLLAALARDGRASVHSLAAETGTEAPTVRKRLRALETDDVLCGYSVRLDMDGLGHETVLVRLAVDPAAVDAVTNRLEELPGFATVYETSGPFAVFAIGTFADESAMAAALFELYDDPVVRKVQVDRVRSVACEGDWPPVED